MLAASQEGVLALRAMMAGQGATGAEPSLLRGGEAAEAQGPESLGRMMRDPRYWRDRDPNYVQQVADGFRRLYPGSARSEEHTSELQSLMRNSYAVFCLKKKNAYKSYK